MSSRIRVGIVSSLAVAVLLLATPSSAQPAVGAEELVARLDRALELAGEGAGAPSPGRMDALRDALGLPLVAEVHGTAVRLPPDPVLEDLRGVGSGDFIRARQHLERLREAAVQAIEAEPPDPARIRTGLDRAYTGLVQVDPGMVDRIRRALAELLQNLVLGLSRAGGPLPLLSWVVVGALGVAAILLVARIRLVPERSVRTGRRAQEPSSPADWRELADDAIRRGELREAVSALYLALLATLAGRGIVTDAATVTAGECRTAVRAARPSLYPAVAEATDRFERVAYGEAGADAADVEALRRAETMARTG